MAVIQKNIKLIVFLSGLLFFGTIQLDVAFGQGVIRGEVVDEDGKPLEIVSVGVANQAKPIGMVTNKKGEFEIKVPSGVSLLLRFSHPSYDVVSRSVILTKGEERNIHQVLKVREYELSEVRIKSQRIRDGFTSIDPMLTKNMIGITAGVEGILKSLPGVNSNNELSSQYSVRGGNFDENLVYVNGIEIYRPLLTRSGEQEGMSFVNPDLVSSMLFSSGGFDAKYGDKMSSVLDIQYKKPKKFGGSVGLNFMGANMHLEGTTKDKKFTYLVGLRHKATQYVLKMLDKKGNYKPSFTDFQAYFTYNIDKKNELSLFGNISYNIYKVVPTTQRTKVGAYNKPLDFVVAFEGQERDVFTTYFAAFTWKNQTSEKFQNSLTYSFFNTIEVERYDLEGTYLLSEASEQDQESNFLDQGKLVGAGSFLDHARNYLNGLVTSLEYKGAYRTSIAYTQWGFKYQYEDIIDRISEWKSNDSAGYIIPDEWLTNPGENPVLTPPTMGSVYKSQHQMSSHRLSTFAQATFDFNKDRMFVLNAGIRASYWTMNNEIVVSPRVNFSYIPDWKIQTSFRVAVGHYAQTPFYKELRDIYGQLHTDVKAQKSIHFVLGSDIDFEMWDRPFKFTGEAYYKYLYDLNPYEVDNVRIRYMAANCSKGYATGVDLRLGGEFVKGAESWLSISFLKTSEDITYIDKSGNSAQTGMIPRPTDQMFSINIFFQDYLLKNKNMKVYVNGVFATGLPSGTMERLEDPERMKWRDKERLPSYKRVDLGMAFLLKGEKRKYGPKNPFTYIKNIWLGLEVFNVFQMKNTISYTWIKTFDGGSYAIPNRLTPLQVNLKLDIEF